MKNNWKKWAGILCMALLPMTSQAQDEVETELGADIVSGYIWRGQDLGGVSVQPSLTVSYKGLYLNVWGSIGLDKEDSREVDLIVGYENGGFSISLTDFWTVASGDEAKYFKYGAHSTSHVFEAQIGYDFGVLAVNWHTNIAGADGVNKDGERAYSSYIQLSAPFSLGGVEWTAEAGATPWATDYYADANGFAVCDLSLTASKEIKITDSFQVPAYAKVTFNPASEQSYITFGLSF